MQQYSLSEFNLLVKKTLADNLAPSYWIVAEIGELNVNRNGHCYLDLVEKDQNQIKSKIRGTIWSFAYVNISHAFESQTGSPLKSGMKVLVNATLEFHEIYGISLNVRDIDPSFTLGEREKQRQETIHRLEEEGVLDFNKSLTIPTVPQNIAIISSESAAGYGDFMNQLSQNAYGYQINNQLFNATMQGEAAPLSIIQCLHNIHEKEDQFDLVVLIRGGGAKTDLDCFDDYDLCAHLAQFPLPIVTGIGHERDSTIADLVACVNLKTPTAVAEYIISAFVHFEGEVQLIFDQIGTKAMQLIRIAHEELLFTESKIKSNTDHKIQKQRYQIDHLDSTIKNRPFEKIKNESSKLQMMNQLIEAHDPKRILQKGFTLTKVNGGYLQSTSKIKKGDELETITATQKIKSKAL